LMEEKGGKYRETKRKREETQEKKSKM